MTEKDLTTDMLETFKNILETIEGKTIKRESTEYHLIIEDCEKAIEIITEYKNNRQYQSAKIMSVIRKVVCSYYEIDEDILNNKNRAAHISNARQVVMYLSKTIGDCSHVDIGRIFERNGSTVLHACNKIKGLIEVDKWMAREISDITNLIKEI